MAYFGLFNENFQIHTAKVRLEGLGQLKKFHLIGTRTHDLSAYSIVQRDYESKNS
jgi:hypothetical protein